MPASPAPQQPKRATARQRAETRRAAEAAARARAERRRRSIIGGIVAGVVVVVALIVVVVVQMQRTAPSETAAVPANVVDDGTAIRVGQADAPVTVDVYEDFLCPACRAVEERIGGTLAELVESGEIAIEYRPVAILDRYSTDRYSTRSLNAAAAVVDAAGPEAFLEFHDLLYADQPAEGGPGLGDDQLVAYAAQAGAEGPEVESAIRDLAFEDWTQRVTDAASKAGLQGTPTIIVDGEPLDLREATPEGLTAAVREAAAR